MRLSVSAQTKEIILARLVARVHDAELDTTEHVAEDEADAEVASSVAEAEALATVVEAGVEPGPAPTPVTIVEDHQDDKPEMPEREEHHQPCEHKTNSHFGFRQARDGKPGQTLVEAGIEFRPLPRVCA